MMCPHGHARLQITERHGVEIDYCPDCRGVWLDRGELDKIIERSATPAAPSGSSDAAGRYGPHEGRRDDQYGTPPKTKRESFLSDLFDF